MIAPELLHENILTLGMRADEVRRSMPGGHRVRYQRVHLLSQSAVAEGLTIPEAATEVRLLETPASLEDALNLARSVKEAAGDRVVRTFSLADLMARADGGWGDVRSVLTQIAACGVADVAELPADRIADLPGAMKMAREAGLLASRITVAQPVGNRHVPLLDAMRRSVDAVGGVERVSPLPRQVPIDKPTTGYEDVRLIALARLAFEDVAHGAVAIEVDWLLYGPKLAQVALTFGADFLDAVPATSDDALGRRRATVEDVERNIRAAGFEPEEYRPGTGTAGGSRSVS